MADINILTPEEYTTKYSQELKDSLSKYDIQINKLGFTGFLLNLLGNTNFDTKMYYDYLFKEGFIATADEDHNLYLHASVYGYPIEFANPSTAKGNFIFDFSLMPTRLSTITKREVIFSNLSFIYNSFNFMTDSVYRFIEDGANYYCIIYTIEGGVQYIPSSTSRIIAPFSNLIQIEKKEIQLQVQNYDFGTFYPYQFSVDTNKFLNDISVQVKKNKLLDNWYDFGIKNVKYFEDAFSDVCFLKPLSQTSYLLEFGSGKKGSYVPNCSAKLFLTVTSGSKGNLNTASAVNLNRTTICIAKQFDSIGTEEQYISGNVKNILETQFDHSEDGSDPIAGLELRKKIISFIQTKDNLVSERDFYNINNKYMKDFKFLFKKSSFIDNIFYLCRVFRDKFQVPIKTFNYTTKSITSEEELLITVTKSNTAFSTLPQNTQYRYWIKALDSLGNYINSNTSLVDIRTENTITLNWNNITNATTYRIYRKIDEDVSYYWETSEPTFTDTNINLVKIRNVENSKIISFYPKFTINDNVFISPFIYEYDDYMTWFKSYILKDNYINYISNIVTRNSNYDIPTFAFNIVYDKDLKYTYVYVKSYQDINTLKFYLSIDTLNIFNQEMIFVDNNTVVYTYDNGDYSLIYDEFILQLKVYNSEGVLLLDGYSESSFQVKETTEFIKLLTFQKDDEKYITNIPILDYDTFILDSQYYLEKLYSFLFTQEFSENRMITDEFQFRFLNTFIVEQFYLNKLIKQTYNFDLKFPLKISIQCYMDQNYLLENDVDLTVEKTNLLLLIAAKLQEDYSGTDIIYYDSKIIDFIHTDRLYIKYITVQIKDSLGNIISNGLESINDSIVIKNIMSDDSITIQDRKLNVLKYTPTFWYWDIDNIDLKFLF